MLTVGAMQRSVIVVGGGTMGLASAWALARAGVRVTVLERFAHHHDRGSHSGYTRVIRQAYHEGERYVPLVRQADRDWVELGARTGRELLVRTGLLELGPGDDADFARSIAACELHGVEHHRYDARALMQRWPFEVPDDWHASFSPSGGYLRVGPCFDALRDEAEAAGASFRYGVVVRAIERADRPRVVIEGEPALEADAIVVTAGAWLPELLPELLPGTLTRLRRVLTWWTPQEQHRDTLARLPVWASYGPLGFNYGFPLGADELGGLKLACHTTPQPTAADAAIEPDALDRGLHEQDLAPLHAFVRAHFPIVGDRLLTHRVCMYTTTPSWDFVIDRDPSDARVVIAGGFSGHGFKFAPAIGRLVRELVLDPDRSGPPAFALSRHRAA